MGRKRMIDFFVSYNDNREDRAWAEWLAWQVEAAGYTAVIQAWDMVYGQDHVHLMDRAVRECSRVLGVLSPSYLQSKHCEAEWRPYYGTDPDGVQGLILLFRVKPCEVGGLLARRNLVNLIGLSQEQAVDALLKAVRLKPAVAPPAARVESGMRRLRPEQAPPFPGAPPVMPPVDYSHLVPRTPPPDKIDGELFSIAFSPDGRWLAAGSEETAVLWDLNSGGPPALTGRHESYVYSIKFSNDSSRFVTGGEDGFVRVWSVEPLALIWEEHQHEAAVYSVAFSHDGKHVASGGYDGKVLLRDAAKGTALRPAGAAVSRIGAVTSVAFSPDARRLLAIGTLGDEVWLLDITSGKARKVGQHDSSVEAVAFSPNGQWLASCGLDKAVCVWKVDAETDALKWRKREHEYLVRSVAFSPDSKTLASVGWDKQLVLYDVETSDLLAKLPGESNDRNRHSDWIWSVAFSTKGMLLASSGSDGRVLLWSVEDGP